MSKEQKKHRVVYLIRTNSMQHEGRVSRLFRALTSRACHCNAFAVVKTKTGFEYDCTEYVARADKISFFPLKIALKLVEVQWAGWRAVRTRYRDADVIIFANHEFLPLGLVLRLLGYRNIVIDLHEHYYEVLFAKKWFSRWFFTKLFSGVIFANRMRAEDFLGKDTDFSKVAITRNLPDVPSGSIETPAYAVSGKFIIALVGSPSPGRYIRESIRVLDRPEFADKIELMTFGPLVREPTSYIKVKEHGIFKHWQIDDLMKDVDASLVFYDPAHNGNFRLCEPNRFFQAYNLGKIIFCFEHSSLAEFYDQECKVIDKARFDDDLREQVEAVLNEKLASRNSSKADDKITRHLLTYEGGLENLDLICSQAPSSQSSPGSG